MKTLSKTLLCLACMMLMVNCEEENINPTGNELDPNNVFTADFTVWDNSVVPAKEGTSCQLTWEGFGSSVLLGSFSVKITLNCNMSTGEFFDLNGTFIAEEGSELFFIIRRGIIAPYTGEGCDYYQNCFNDQAQITGGTGRFVYVTGSFYPNAFIHNGNDHDDDKWFAKFVCEGKLVNFDPSGEDLPYYVFSDIIY
ncbi:MAG: hypothetical protein ABR597_09280 [Bacteroidales bacterium]